MQRTLPIKQSSARRSFPQRSIIADIMLAGLVSGPLAAPFLAASSLPLLPDIASIVYWMGLHVCPQPQMGIVLAPPFAMAVCMRCYGTVLGLLATRLLFAARGADQVYWLNQYGRRGALITGLLILAYPAELAAQTYGLWGLNHGLMTFFGLVSGIALGLFIIPTLHAQPTHQG